MVRCGGSVHGPEEAMAMIHSILDGWWIGGKYTEKFESLMAEFHGTRNALFCNSGSSGNLMALTSLNLPRNSEVITPALTFSTTFSPILHNNLVPVVVDSDLGTYNVNVDAVEKAVTDNTRAIMIANIAGNMSDLRRLREIADDNKLFLIEDCCEALGSRFDGKYTGTYGDLATFSFYPSHHITAGGGGMVITNNDELFRLLRSLRNWGRTYNKQGVISLVEDPKNLRRDFDQQFIFMTKGFNFMATEVQAAMGVAQMGKLKKFEEIRRRNFETLYSFFGKYKDYFILPRSIEKADPVWFFFPLTIRDGAPFTREDIMKYLYQNKIESRYLVAGNILKQPAYEGVQARIAGSLENADKAYKDSFFIGNYQGIDDKKLGHVKEKVDVFMESAMK